MAAPLSTSNYWPKVFIGHRVHPGRTRPSKTGDNRGVSKINWSNFMAKTFRTEADRKATPRPVAPKGVCFTAGKGQMRSLERGTATNNKKNPGKRCKKGG